MTQRLIYVVGPSGAGKDSALQGLRQSWKGLPPAHWARRTITRPAQAGGESHEWVNELEFEQLYQDGRFAMQWEANGLSYGIRQTELTPLSTGHCVFVNGSRAYLPQVLRRWPEATVVQITAPVDVLRQRLQARRRESAESISDRLSRGVRLELPTNALQIINDGPIEETVDMLRAGLQERLVSNAAVLR